MTVIHLKPTYASTPNTAGRTNPMKPRGKHSEVLFGVATAGTVLAAATLATFNGGLSLRTGDIEMTLDGSLSKGVHLTFAALNRHGPQN